MIAPFSQAGWVGFFGFGTLAVLWFVDRLARLPGDPPDGTSPATRRG